MPTERPILFSAPMVRATLDGRKTQTRRVLKITGPMGDKNPVTSPDESIERWDDGSFHYVSTGGLSGPWPCPYGVPGDVLWVKETLRRAPDLWTYAADGQEVGWPARMHLAGKPRDVVVSIHCPRVVSRITLRITDVRVERLNEIDDSDAFAEGIGLLHDGVGIEDMGPNQSPIVQRIPRVAYRYLWERINGPGSWDENPWVWAVSFERVRP